MFLDTFLSLTVCQLDYSHIGSILPSPKSLIFQGREDAVRVEILFVTQHGILAH